MELKLDTPCIVIIHSDADSNIELKVYLSMEIHFFPFSWFESTKNDGTIHFYIFDICSHSRWSTFASITQHFMQCIEIKDASVCECDTYLSFAVWFFTCLSGWSHSYITNFRATFFWTIKRILHWFDAYFMVIFIWHKKYSRVNIIHIYFWSHWCDIGRCRCCFFLNFAYNGENISNGLYETLVKYDWQY